MKKILPLTALVFLHAELNLYADEESIFCVWSVEKPDTDGEATVEFTDTVQFVRRDGKIVLRSVCRLTELESGEFDLRYSDFHVEKGEVPEKGLWVDELNDWIYHFRIRRKGADRILLFRCLKSGRVVETDSPIILHKR